MPKVKKGDKKPEFIQSCVKQLIGEGKTQEQALGECYGIWKQSMELEQKDYNYIKKVMKKL